MKLKTGVGKQEISTWYQSLSVEKVQFGTARRKLQPADFSLRKFQQADFFTVRFLPLLQQCYFSVLGQQDVIGIEGGG